MWVMKWFLASIVLKENVLPYVTGHVTERINGAVSGYHITWNTYLDTLLLNLRNLFPYEYGLSGAVLVVAFIFAVIVLPVVAGHVKMRKNETVNVKEKGIILQKPMYTVRGQVCIGKGVFFLK